MKTPHTLHGTSGFTTVPASSLTRAKLILAKPTLSYCEAYASSVSEIGTYCSPINTLMPTVVKAEDKMTDFTVFNIFSVDLSNFDTIPKEIINRPTLRDNGNIPLI